MAWPLRGIAGALPPHPQQGPTAPGPPYFPYTKTLFFYPNLTFPSNRQPLQFSFDHDLHLAADPDLLAHHLDLHLPLAAQGLTLGR